MKPVACSVEDAAKSLSVCRATIYNWMRDGRIQTVKVGGRRLVNVASIQRLAGEDQ